MRGRQRQQQAPGRRRHRPSLQAAAAREGARRETSERFFPGAREELGSNARPRPKPREVGRQRGRATRTGRGLLQVLLQQRLLQQELEPGGLRRRARPAGGGGFPVGRFRAHRCRLPRRHPRKHPRPCKSPPPLKEAAATRWPPATAPSRRQGAGLRAAPLLGAEPQPIGQRGGGPVAEVPPTTAGRGHGSCLPPALTAAARRLVHPLVLHLSLLPSRCCCLIK